MCTCQEHSWLQFCIVRFRRTPVGFEIRFAISVFVSHSYRVCRDKFQSFIRQACHSDINMCTHTHTHTHTEIFKWTVYCPVVAAIRCCAEIDVVRSKQQCSYEKFCWHYKSAFSCSNCTVVCCGLIADLGFIPLVLWHPSTVLIVLWRFDPVLGTGEGEICPLLYFSVCILSSGYNWKL